MNYIFNKVTLGGALGGTILSIFSNIYFHDLLKTVVMAMVGTTVSFLLSLGLKMLIIYMRKKIK